MHALPGALAGGASGALAAPGSDGVPAAMLTRSRTGGAPAADAPASALLPGRATAAAEAGLDTDDEDYRVEDDYAPEDDELLDEELELLGRGRRRHGGAAGAVGGRGAGVVVVGSGAGAWWGCMVVGRRAPRRLGLHGRAVQV